MVGEVVDALPVMQMQLVQLGVDPAAGQEWVGRQQSAVTGEAFAALRLVTAAGCEQSPAQHVLAVIVGLEGSKCMQCFA